MDDTIDYTNANPAGVPNATKQITDQDPITLGHMPVVKLAVSADGITTLTPNTVANGLLVDVSRVTGNVAIVDGGGAISVDDNGGSLTVDGTVSVSGSVAVTGPLTDTQLRASAVPVSVASLPLPSGASTEATLALIKAKTDNLDVLLSTRLKPADTLAVLGTITNVVHVDDNSATLSVDDGGGSLTIDGTVGISGSVAVTGPLTDAQLRATPVPISGTITATPTGTQDVNQTQINGVAVSVGSGVLGTGTQRVVLATDQPVIPVSDNGGSLTVDGTVAISGAVTVDSELTTADLDTGAGTDTRAVIGIVIAESGGGQLVGSAHPLPISAASLPLPSLAATSTKQSDGSQKAQIVDGSGNVIGSTSNALNVHLDGGVTVLSGTFTDTSDHAEDSAHSSGDDGNFVLGVRNDSAATTLTSTDGDYSPVAVDNKGRLIVDASTVAIPVTDNSGTLSIDDGGGSITVDGTVTITPSGTQTVSGSKTNNNAAPGATNVGALVAVANASAPTQVEGNLVALRTNLAGDVAITLDGESVAVTGPLTDTQLRASAVPISATNLDVALSTRLKPADTLTAVTTVGTITNVVHVDDNSSTLSVDDGGGSLTVDGSVTVSGTVTATIAAGASTIAKAEDEASADADVGVPAMAILKASPADTAGTDGDYQMLQMKSGRLWVSATIDAALPTGANAIGKLAANSGVTIGAVEIAAAQTLATLTTITNVVHTDDNSGSLTIDAPVGTPAFVRLSDGAAAITTLPVSLASVPSHAVTNAGTFAVQDSEKLADNAGFTDGTTKVMPAGYIYDEVAGAALTENDVAAPRINANRATIATLEDGVTRARYATVTAANALKVDASGVAVPVTDNSGSLTVDNGGTFAVQDSILEGAIHNEDVASGNADPLISVGAIRKDTPVANAGVSNDGDYTNVLVDNLGKLWTAETQAEDAAHTSGDKGAFVLGVRNDANAAFSGTDLDYTPLNTDQRGIQRVEGPLPQLLTITITRPADTTAYAADDTIADSTSAPTAFTGTGFAKYTAGSGAIVSVELIDSTKSATPANLELWIFDTAYTNNNDNAAWSPSDANANTLIGVIPLGGSPAPGGSNNAVYQANGLFMPFTCTSTTSLWFALVVRNAYTPTSSEVFKIRVGVIIY